MGLDWGRVRVGVALSDLSQCIATPRRTLKAVPRKALLEEIQRIIEWEEVTLVIVGIPYNMDGSEGESALQARRLVEDVRQLGVAVEEHDERLTSFSAKQVLRELGKKPSREKEQIDRVAAAILLQDYLDSRQV